MSALEETMVNIQKEEAAHYSDPDQTIYYESSKNCRHLSFSTSSSNFDGPYVKKQKTIRDSNSHRLNEKRRRDRMNNCLAELSSLIPTTYLRQGQSRIEKTGIIELAIKHIRTLTNSSAQSTVLKSSLPDRYLGFKECQDEVMRYLVEVEGWDAMDKLAHLEQAGEKFRIMNDESLSKFDKEDQYRHADEEMGICHKYKNNRMKHWAVGDNARSYPPQGQMSMNATPPELQHEDPALTDIQTGLQDFNNVDSAQQVTREHLHWDHHQRTMLQSQYNAGNFDDSGVSTNPSSISPNETEDKLSEEEGIIRNLKSPNATESANSSGRGTGELSPEEKLGCSVYKFKHNLVQRFALEERKVSPIYTSSSISDGSIEETRIKNGKRKIKHENSSPFRPIKQIEKSIKSKDEPSIRTSDGFVTLNNYSPSALLNPVGILYDPPKLSFKLQNRRLLEEWQYFLTN